MIVGLCRERERERVRVCVLCHGRRFMEKCCIVVISVNVWFCKQEQHDCILKQGTRCTTLDNFIRLENSFCFAPHTKVYWENDLSKLSRRYGAQPCVSEQQDILFKEDIERVLCLTGYKPAFAQQVANRFFSSVSDVLQRSTVPLESPQTAQMWSCQLALYLSKCVELEGGVVTDETWEDIMAALHFVGHHVPIIILVGGTSGCGKSTLAYMLANKLGINKVVSTDMIRACLRTHSTPNDTFYGVLHSSSYEGNSHLPPQFMSASETTTPRKRLIKSYKLQAELMEPFIHHLIANSLWQKESLVVEGVHLSVKMMKQLVEEFHVVIPFITYISNESKHMNRFAVRVKYMALNSHGNKYVKNFQNIRQIQEYLCNKADKEGFPKIDNTNTDRSLAAAHSLVFSCIREFWRTTQQDARASHTALPEIVTKERIMWKSSKMALLDIYMHRLEKLSVERNNSNNHNDDVKDDEMATRCRQQQNENLVLLKGKLALKGENCETKQIVEYLRQLCSESEKDEHKGD